MPAGDGWAGLHTDTPIPLKHESGGSNDHIAPKRQRPVALWSDLVAIATTLRQSAGRPCRFGALWSFAPSDKAVWTGPRGPMDAGRRSRAAPNQFSGCQPLSTHSPLRRATVAIATCHAGRSPW